MRRAGSRARGTGGTDGRDGRAGRTGGTDGRDGRAGRPGGTAGRDGGADVSGHAHRHALDAVHEVASQVVDVTGALEYDVA